MATAPSIAVETIDAFQTKINASKSGLFQGTYMSNVSLTMTVYLNVVDSKKSTSAMKRPSARTQPIRLSPGQSSHF